MVNDIAIQDFVNAIKEEPTETNTNYMAKVSRVDGEGVTWVHIQGSEKETPVASTNVNVKSGDTVEVNWRNNRIYITGNYSAPAVNSDNFKDAKDDIKEKLKKELEEETEEGESDDKLVEIWYEYNMSTSRSQFIQADTYYWSDTVWEYVSGLFMWIRTVYKYADGTIVYGEPTFDMASQAIAEANEASANALSAAQTASGIASAASATANAKKRVFNSTPTTPYDLNDLWFDGAHGNTYICTRARSTGSFSSSDWTLYSTDVSQHFWYDPTSGAHISDTQGDVTTGNSQTIASTGTVMMRNGKLVTSWTGSSSADAALNFYDCDTTTVGDANHLVASYAKAGITHYINNKRSMALTDSALTFFDPADGTTKEAIFGSSGTDIYSNGKLGARFRSGSINFYDSAGTTSIAQFGSTARIGKVNGGHIEIDNTNLRFYNNTTMFGGIRKGYYDRQMQIGTWKDDYTYGSLSLDGDDGKAVLTVQSGTSSSDNYSSLTMTPTAGSFTLGSDTSNSSSFDAILQLTTNKLALYYGGVYDSDIRFSVIPSTGQLTLAGHSSPVGTQVNGTKVDTSSTAIPDSINVTSGNGTSIAQLVLPAGVWIVYGQARFASNSTGYRRMGFGTSKNVASLDVTFGASSSGATQIANTRVLSPSSQTTYYLNVTHNGGATLAISDISFAAWRLV